MGALRVLKGILNHPLNRPARGAALARLIRWQIAARAMPAGIALPFVDDTVLLTRHGMTGATGNWYCGLHEPAEMAFVLHMLRPGALFVDVGANIGSYTILAAATGADVVAIEPIPATFFRLAANIDLNGFGDRVARFHGGVGDQAGTLRFTAAHDTMNHVVEDEAGESSIAVEVKPLDTILDGRRPQLIKIDVEGYELPVLRGASAAALADPDLLALVVETNGSGARYGVDGREIFAFLERFGFVPAGYDPFARRLGKAGSGGDNTIFVRDAERVAALCASAPRYRLVNGTI
ncbi:FkbM family methyltransferase [Kaistia adipata]|uniref:FkbM family methyltransferase n=1 Tax=Kaistia adipata TaxID=166954 RepID=UPI000422CB70|nr:FkbM family methyltransferase [Kaistia adipata]